MEKTKGMAIVSILTLTLIIAGVSWWYYETLMAEPQAEPTEPTPDPIAIESVRVDLYSDRAEVFVTVDKVGFDNCFSFLVGGDQLITPGNYTYLGNGVYRDDWVSPYVAGYDWTHLNAWSVWDWDTPNHKSPDYTCPTPVVTFH